MKINRIVSFFLHFSTFPFFISRLRPSDTDVRLLSYTHQLLNSLEEETGVDPGYIVNGGLFIASSKVLFSVRVWGGGGGGGGAAACNRSLHDTKGYWL